MYKFHKQPGVDDQDLMESALFHSVWHVLKLVLALAKCHVQLSLFMGSNVHWRFLDTQSQESHYNASIK